ncbi:MULTISPECIES: multifunctional CCA addition/repair protein [unclassified Herbaspirillum]|uniref:multifunctional CCA addition/repair protein n=1 Tax=unclassified Herbaspirillum TaxID=2624150 RepID=UPI000E2E9BAA|nr:MULTISPECIES: multifunctional CCA addition/repair protein [unclassified Herbaspirillum]RFB71026.1 multifunctional CCA addition/repair protein [Herbaspirillum sp. 3R-3a1]TFI08453.1 multifunctional CCA addition/repair protein [Herbaspirillum sp. 3R11]TFI14868.1 multifunctional CCA addition/repair protein [Herbaspirillum sp. 3R-11]TFI30335.1 multifunctional CCA addition/repair protein [Herbaspirillum sp. 3C11]
MKIYVVGGAVRDELLGLPVQDHDYVVVGATPEDMLAQGFRPVGKDFPVFLHPDTQEEYALARTERKTAPGYKGFVFHTDSAVTLEQDLARRDLTINAIAKGEDGVLVDPYHGQEDIRRRVFRHVSDAFIEDPVRILRLARFAARFPDFTVAPETNVLMQKMVAAGEVDALVPERVWQELARGMMEQTPSRMFNVLRDCGALARILPELDALWGVPQPAKYHPEIDTGVHVMMVLDYAAGRGYSLGVRFAALMHDLGKGTTPPDLWPSHHGHEGRSVELVQGICDRLKVPNDCRDVAVITAREHGNVGRAFELRPATIVNLLARCDGFRKPARFHDMLQASECDRRGRTGFEDVAFPQLDYLMGALKAAQGVDAGAIAAKFKEQPQRIPEAIVAARTEAVAEYAANAAN